MTLCRFVAIGLMSWVGLLVMTGPVLAQDRIPQDAIVATDIHTPEQKQAITTYIGRWVGVLKEADGNNGVSDAQISEARNRLLNPLRTPGATDFFKREFSTHASEKMAPLLDADRLMVRLNMMIVVTRFSGDQAVSLAEKGLDDESPSVRYWAAKAIANFAKATDSEGNYILSTKQKLALLRTLDRVGKEEASSEVLRQVLEAMAAMDLPTAPQRVLDLLNARLTFHVDRPYEPYQAETAGLRAIYQKLLKAQAPDLEQVRNLAGISQRYMNLVSKNLAEAKDAAKDPTIENPIDQSLESDHAAMLELADYALQFCHSAMKSQEPVPDSVIQKITFKQWKEINSIAVDKWGKVLQATPFGFKPGDLAIVKGG